MWADRPRFALCDLREGFSLLMDAKLLDVDVCPKVSPALGEVVRSS